ncbi:hypothetical protein AAFF_G00079850 [Aldrovandia affinis]|uniref:Uncharacterized protein n=1 Tax=Aldrovandia affinis TaxID=143900 RepID=A0AAD7R1E5_9TELE|nr:hypothetical protein AAFF_G00079850 [Aldrovandia affinis]
MIDCGFSIAQNKGLHLDNSKFKLSLQFHLCIAPLTKTGLHKGSQKEASELPVSAERGGPTKVQQQLLMKMDAILANQAEILRCAQNPHLRSPRC